MTKTSIEIDNLLFLSKRKVDLPTDLEIFSLTMAYLINDFSEMKDLNIEAVMNSIIEHNEIIKRCKN